MIVHLPFTVNALSDCKRYYNKGVFRSVVDAVQITVAVSESKSNGLFELLSYVSKGAIQLRCNCAAVSNSSISSVYAFMYVTLFKQSPNNDIRA
ncbi:hypothetical protein M513_03247 [Trichuris suis]|uniref:Uncharacterized protein n=1 Tax=Trichuris suis TaxID=68888 RepID=A0A085MF12_9BILA|nr:hypothetical protein M513_03247 [Trichuris suis]